MAEPTVDLNDPEYDAAVKRITAAVMASGYLDGDPQPSFRAVVFVLSMLLDADASLQTPKAIRERGEEVGKVVAGQIKWMREQRAETGEPMLRMILGEMMTEDTGTTH